MKSLAASRSSVPGPYNFVAASGIDPLEMIKRGIATTVIMAEWREESEEDERLVRFLHPIAGPKTPSFQCGQTLHLTSIGWRRVRALVKRDLEENIRNRVAPSALFDFAQFEEEMLPLLALVDKAVLAFGYEDNLGISFPYLVLVPAPLEGERQLPLKRHKLTKVNHQAGGYCCSQITFNGIILRPNAAALKLAEALNREFDESSCSAPPGWNTLSKYMEILHAHGFDCPSGYEAMEESVYPIAPRHAKALTRGALPADPESLVDWVAYDRDTRADLIARGLCPPKGMKWPLWRFLGAWRLYLVTENSD